jgi:hypothetical protein
VWLKLTTMPVFKNRRWLAQLRGYLHVVIESDSLVVVNLCNTDDQNRSNWELLSKRSKKLGGILLALAFLLLGGKQIMLPICVLSKIVVIGGGDCGLIITMAFSLTLSRVIVILV